MTASLLMTGTLVGALLGGFHAVYVYRLLATEPPAGATSGPAHAVYYALWTFGLWVIFGSYVLVLWLIGAIFYAVFKAFR